MTLIARPAAPVADGWTFGPIALQRIVESEEPLLSPFEIYPDCTAEHIAANRHWLAPRFWNPEVELLSITIQSFLIRHAGKTILVDTCSGDDKPRARPFFDRRRWPWMDRLRAAGVAPEDVDVVMCSHLHVDHVGWNTKLEDGRWVPTFPNARYLISRREWAYWQQEAASTGIPRTGDYVADSVLPVFSAGQADLIDEDCGIADGIWLEPAPGHTPGQFVVHLEGGGRRGVLAGDVIHHPLQLRYPEWSTRFCADPDTARQTRQRILAVWADSGLLVLPAHFPTPTAGTIERCDGHFSWRYDGEAEAIGIGC